MTSDFNFFYEQKIEEMASKIEPLNTPVNFYIKKWESVRNRSFKLDDYNFYNNILLVYFVELSKFDFEIYIFSNKELVSYLNFEKFDKGIQMSHIWRSSKGKLFLSDFYIDYLLKMYPYIVSDFSLTAKGFSLYDRILNDSRVSFTILNYETGEEFLVQTSDELKSYYGNEDLQKFLFKIKLKNI
jgi:hypothetical protein